MSDMSLDEYLSAHYRLIREQAIGPLRDALSRIQSYPQLNEEPFRGAVGIYDRARVTAVKMSNKGVAFRVSFSMIRVGKRVIWEQSKRLISGSLVVLIRKDNPSKIVVVVVAARPLSKILENPPEIYLFCESLEIDVDSAAEFLMVESRTSYFEADRHVLRALQHMANEPFPLQDHLIRVKKQVQATSDVHDHFHLPSTSSMDNSQRDALQRMLEKRLAIVQGPPGTGKTYVSVEVLRALLANWRNGDPPLIVLAQTNHALDQLVRHILQFEPDVVRVGGQSKDDVVKMRTLYEVSQRYDKRPPPGCQIGMARKNMEVLQIEIAGVLSPLQSSPFPLDPKLLEKFNLLSAVQVDNFITSAARWGHTSPFALWLGDSLKPVFKQPAEDFDFEEAELEVDHLNENEKEAAKDDDDPFETLYGPEDLEISDSFACGRGIGPPKRTSPDRLLRTDDLWSIDEAQRPAVYRYLQMRMKAMIFEQFQVKARAYNEQAHYAKIGRWERQENVLKEQKVIALTTTGFSKNRALISALRPRIILCEEAAEVLEAPVTVTCVPSLEQLILVGDHSQLRPHTQCRRLEGEPHHLNISLFERMVNNNIDFTTLLTQRRMIPEIRRLLLPIYGDKIKDHDSVLQPSNRPRVQGMGGINSFCFSHEWPESRDDLMSSFNPTESSMIRGFVEYLVANGETQITCLTFYNGQRKALIKDFRSSKLVNNHMPKVVTVDSYQGEENDIVILSLVRSNGMKQVGFLDNANRVCVALSRARRGFYLFGNCRLLYESSPIWNQVLGILAGQPGRDRPQLCPGRLAKAFPICCENHHFQTSISGPEDWEKLKGGCQQRCEATLACGHSCTLPCHPFAHDTIGCAKCPQLAKAGTPAPIVESSRTPSPTKAIPGVLRGMPVSRPAAYHDRNLSQSTSTSLQELQGLTLTTTNASDSSSIILVDVDVDDAPAPMFRSREVSRRSSPTKAGFGKQQRVVEIIDITHGAKNLVDQSRRPSLLDD
jgi:helicase required for RNAi-mediated heterochromatin assembly 1